MAPSRLSCAVALPWMPILCSMPVQKMALRSPSSVFLSSVLTRNLGTTNRLMPLLPAGASGRRASTRCTMFSAMSCSPALMKIFWPVIL